MSDVKTHKCPACGVVLILRRGVSVKLNVISLSLFRTGFTVGCACGGTLDFHFYLLGDLLPSKRAVRQERKKELHSDNIGAILA